jgi:hypothetical protein
MAECVKIAQCKASPIRHAPGGLRRGWDDMVKLELELYSDVRAPGARAGAAGRGPRFKAKYFAGKITQPSIAIVGLPTRSGRASTHVGSLSRQPFKTLLGRYPRSSTSTAISTRSSSR